MENFDSNIIKVITDIKDIQCYMLQVKVRTLSGLFAVRAIPEKVWVESGATIIDAVKTSVSGNQKEMNGYFATDAFAGMTSATIFFGYGPEIKGMLETSDIQNLIQPAFAIIPGIPDATNAWLQNI
jgi:hypothetical protein